MAYKRQRRHGKNPAIAWATGLRWDRPLDEQGIALTLLATAETAHAFSAWLPSYFTIKSFALDGDPATVSKKVADLRSGYRPAVLFGVVLGAGVTIMTKSLLPVIASAAAAAFMISQYEQALPPEMQKNPIMAVINGHIPQAALPVG